MNIKTKVKLVNAAYLRAREYNNEEPQNIRYGESPKYWYAVFEISNLSSWSVLEAKSKGV